MLKYEKLGAVGVHRAAVRVCSFDPHLDPPSPTRYCEEQRRTTAYSSFSPHRSLLSPDSPRLPQTAQTSRLSQYVQREVGRLHESYNRVEEFTPAVRDKIHELRSLMQAKEAALRSTNTKLPLKCYFSEYKMGPREQPQASLHSRTKPDSPYMRALKTKRKFAARDEDSPPLQDARDARDSKFVMVGGAISVRDSFNESFLSPSKLTSRLTSKSNRYSIRAGRPPASSAEPIPENDCKPWEIHKYEQLEEYGHLNFL